MFKKQNQEKDIEEILLHVEKIKSEKDKFIEEKIYSKKSQEDINHDNIPPEDIFEIVDNTNEEAVTKMRVDNGTHGSCDICEQEFEFEKNLSGLVIQDKIFLCEKCCQNASNDNLMNLTKSKSANPKDVRPIALWLMDNSNRKNLIEK
jgi:hypothetical protein